MKTFFTKNINAVLTSLAVVFLAIIIGYFAVGLSYIVNQVNEANANRASSSQASDFNISAAEGLDYKGLATSTASALLPATSTSAATTSSTP